MNQLPWYIVIAKLFLVICDTSVCFQYKKPFATLGGAERVSRLMCPRTALLLPFVAVRCEAAFAAWQVRVCVQPSPTVNDLHILDLARAAIPVMAIISQPAALRLCHSFSRYLSLSSQSFFSPNYCVTTGGWQRITGFSFFMPSLSVFTVMRRLLFKETESSSRHLIFSLREVSNENCCSVNGVIALKGTAAA